MEKITEIIGWYMSEDFVKNLSLEEITRSRAVLSAHTYTLGEEAVELKKQAELKELDAKELSLKLYMELRNGHKMTATDAKMSSSLSATTFDREAIEAKAKARHVENLLNTTNNILNSLASRIRYLESERTNVSRDPNP